MGSESESKVPESSHHCMIPIHVHLINTSLKINFFAGNGLFIQSDFIDFWEGGLYGDRASATELFDKLDYQHDEIISKDDWTELYNFLNCSKMFQLLKTDLAKVGAVWIMTLSPCSLLCIRVPLFFKVFERCPRP